MAVLHFHCGSTALSLWQYRTFCALSTYPYSYLYCTSCAVASLILALVGINLYIHKATFLSLVTTACSTVASFQVFLCQYVYKLTIWNVVDVLARSSISHSHCGRLSPSCNKSLFYFACFYFYLVVSSRRGYCRLAAIVFAAWVAVPFFTTLRHF